MLIDFRNTNTIWASILVETLARLGLTTAVICPGSRSAPLAIAFAHQGAIEAIPILDERSAAFFALGLARRSKRPIALVCTSGTAGANFYPAVIEARESRVPLLVLTADRPPELRDCNAGQSIDQQQLYGAYPNWYSELAVPAIDLSLLTYLRQTMIFAWERTLYPVPGAVHLNLPLREPLVPIVQPEAEAIAATFPIDHFFDCVPNREVLSAPTVSETTWQAIPFPDRGVIVAGVAQPRSPERYCQSIAQLAKTLGYPVLAEGLSPVRNYAQLNPYLISTYDLILRNGQIAEELAPEGVIRIGEMPTSKTLRTWLTKTQPRQWIIDPGDRNLDPLHGNTVHLRLSVERWAVEQWAGLPAARAAHAYLDRWCAIESEARQLLDRTLEQTQDQTESLFEGKVAWMMSQHLPVATPLFIANSMSVRDVESFWKPGNLQIQPYCNRGANGIDGTLSTALGIAHRQQSSVLLTGDLALLHDTNGFLLKNYWVGHLTIVLVNNNGGGIFESLAIAQFNPPFEEFFATPQNIDFAQLCATYGVEHEQIISWQQLQQRLEALPETGIRVLEVRSDRQRDAKWRQVNFSQLAATL
jgi:2-succinyl-5-enolpyruvyl-6-hydroxy-3-cyclohexene-1-carboxylate synthase